MADPKNDLTAREQLVKLLNESHDTAAGWHPWNFGHGADAILAAGWRPPLAADETQLVWGWQSSTGGEFFVIDDEDTARRFVASCEGRVRLAYARWELVEPTAAEADHV